MSKTTQKRFGPREFAYTIVMTALTAVVTMTVKVPTPLVAGYFHLGDVVQIFSSITFGWVVGGISGGIGASMADLLGGYPFWAPITIVIRGFQGVMMGFIGYGRNVYWKIAAGVIGVAWNFFAYFLVYIPLYGWAAAVVSTVPYIPMIAVVVAIAIPLHYAVLRAYPRLTAR